MAAPAEAARRDAEEYLSYLAIERGRSPATIEAYRRDLAGYLGHLAETGVALEAAAPGDIEAYLTVLAGRGLRNSSRSRALVAIRGLHAFCRDEREHPLDPAADVDAPPVPAGIPKALSEEEVTRLLAAVPGEHPVALRDRAILELLYATGLRISELAGLCLDDVDREDRLLRAFGKGAKERIVPFGRAADAALDAWLAVGRPALSPDQFARRADADAIFLSRRGRRMTRQAIWTVVRAASERAGLGAKVTPHVLRHSFATHLLDHGADVRVVQELLGHASIATTQIYTKVSQEHLRRAYLAAHPRASVRRDGAARLPRRDEQGDDRGAR